MISDMLSKNVKIRINPIATELFIRNRKLFFLITYSYFSVQESIRLDFII